MGIFRVVLSTAFCITSSVALAGESTSAKRTIMSPPGKGWPVSRHQPVRQPQCKAAYVPPPGKGWPAFAASKGTSANCDKRDG